MTVTNKQEQQVQSKIITPKKNSFQDVDQNCAKLIIVQITDVYTLEHLASVKTLVNDVKARNKGAKVISMITGDFLSPYLLSTVDHGQGMMDALAQVPIDVITWGNHEADIEHSKVCEHVREWNGKWINSNMLDHEAMDAQQEYDVVEITSPNGENKRKVGLVAVLSNDPVIYAHFKAPGAFGGATITDPWEALTKYKTILEGPDHNCDMVLPLEHLYVPDNHKTCQEFDFPVILSGHDHHRVDETVNGTRLLKPGQDATFATVLEISWEQTGDPQTKPTIRANFAKCSEWKPDPILAKQCDQAYDCLLPLRHTQLASVPEEFQPLSSTGSRGRVCSMGQFVCTMLRSALNSSKKKADRVDSVLLMGGNIRGGTDYPNGSYFSLEALESEIKSDEVVGIVQMPGWLLAKGIAATHAGDPIPGWMQFDNGVVETTSKELTHVAYKKIDPNITYNVATKISDLTNGQSPPWTKYYKEHPELLPTEDELINIRESILNYIAECLWRGIWEAMTVQIGLSSKVSVADISRKRQAKMKFDMLDIDNKGFVGVDEIRTAFRDFLQYSVDKNEDTLAKYVLSVADTRNRGRLDLNDFVGYGANVSKGSRVRKLRTLSPLPSDQHYHQTKKEKSTFGLDGSDNTPVDDFTGLWGLN